MTFSRWCHRTATATIEQILATSLPTTQAAVPQRVDVHGWLKTIRRQKKVVFASLMDGTTTQPLQVRMNIEFNYV